jgi:hypothetical protein
MFYLVKRMIRGLGAETTSTYSQTLNWYELRLADLEPEHKQIRNESSPVGHSW